MVSCNQAAKLVSDVLALSMPLTLPFWSIPLRRIARQEPFLKRCSPSLLVNGLDTRFAEDWVCAVC